MKFLETEHEKKSFAISTTIMAILLLLCIYFGLTYLDPPPENGIAINFGDVDAGSGKNNSMETVQTAPQPTQATPQETNQAEEVATQDNVDAIAIPETKTPKPVKEPVKETPVKPVETKPTPSKTTTDALSNLLSGPKNEGTAKDGDGDSTKPGNQGSLDGSIYANSYYGQGGGIGTGSGSYGLAGRSLKKRDVVMQNCNESGKVVVQIRVNRNGDVIAAERTQGTTNSAKCLVDAAIATAKTYKWQPDSKAPEVQIGFIEINFRLGE